MPQNLTRPGQAGLSGQTSGAIYVANINGTGQLALGNTVPASALGWSSDGTAIYFWAATSRELPHAFYSIPAAGGTATPLSGGQSFWAWFYDGGFEVLAEAGVDYLLFGANEFGQPGGKCNLLKLKASPAAEAPSVVFSGLGDIYTPSRGRLDGRLIFQADHDRRGSHRVYRLEDSGQATSLTELYSGSPCWNADQSRFVFIQQPVSTFGATAYQGKMWVRSNDGSLVVQNSFGTAACPSFYTPAGE